MKIVARLEPYLCRANPNKIYVFEDNLIKKGKAGQACIRDEPNAFGIPTKRLPAITKEAFFSDREDEFKAVTEAFKELIEIAAYKEVIFPAAGLGTGLAKMEQYSPKLFKHLNLLIKTHFDSYISL